MIRVAPSPEPPEFNAEVRIPGGRALLELADKPSGRTAGRPHSAVTTSCARIPSGSLPAYWRRCLPQLRTAYHGICAYAGMRIHAITGTSTADHFVAKSASNGLAYEWANYRLACPLMNARKSNHELVLDPFEVSDDWFDMEFVFFQVRPASHLAADLVDRIETTITQLGLNDEIFLEQREEYFTDYMSGNPTSWLRREAPFMHAQLHRAGKLRR